MGGNDSKRLQLSITHKQHMVRIPSRINFRLACGAFEKVDQRWVISPLSLVGRLSKLCRLVRASSTHGAQRDRAILMRARMNDQMVLSW